MTLINEVLQRVELFRGLEAEEIRELARGFEELSLEEDHFVFQEGQSSDAFFIVREGAVILFRNTVGRPVHLLARLGAYDFFGELGLFDSIEHTMSARTAREFMTT